MASGRKHASFRHRSQSDNGVIIELTPLSVGGCISSRLLPSLGASQRLPPWLQHASWAGTGGAVLCFWRCRQWGSDVRVHWSPCVGACLWKVSNETRCDILYRS